MSDSVGTGLIVVLGVIAAVGLVLVVGVFYLLRRYRVPIHGVAATIASLLYVISPVDAVPEIPLGPVGLVDDAAVILGALFYVRRLVEARRTGPLELDARGRGRGRRSPSK
ncbi:YkvA family protein [Parafrankia discariae]|uniref:YkvA family protein n=1 Tax=Parafrankia discariae TaxID=365528 RepID=UPI00037CAC46|nr:YkvA family protein [Parafrankia discariae]